MRGSGWRIVAVLAVAAALSGAAALAAGVRSHPRGGPASAAHRLRRSPGRTACGTGHRRIRRHGHRRTVRVHVCVRLTRFVPVHLIPGPSRPTHYRPVHRPSRSFGDTDPALPVSGGPVRMFRGRPGSPALIGIGGAADRAHAAGAGVVVRTLDLAAKPDSSGVARSGLSLSDMRTAAETSIASHGSDVIFTANGYLKSVSTPRAAAGGAAYSTDAGVKWTMLDAGSIFNVPPSPTSACAPYCDQVVAYDPYAKVFVWLVQRWTSATSDNVIYIGWASPADLEAYGADAWQSDQANSQVLFGTGNYLDQPRIGMTPRFLYISFNRPTGTILRIPNGAFPPVARCGRRKCPRRSPPSLTGQFISGGSQVYDPSCSCQLPAQLRVARDVTPAGIIGQDHTPREYFVGRVIGDNSALAVATIADDSGTLQTTVVPTWTIAAGPNNPPETGAANLNPAGGWSSPVPTGVDWLYRQSGDNNNSGGTIAVTGVTMSRDGRLFAAWSESRDVLCPYNPALILDFAGTPNPNDSSCTGGGQTLNALPPGLHTYLQPHIGVAELFPYVVTRFDFPLPTETIAYGLDETCCEFVNPGYALALPDLATTDNGDVAMSFYGGGGPTFFVNHAVGFLYPGRPVFVNDGVSTGFTSDTANEYGDYDTVRAATGSCFVSAAVDTDKAQQNHMLLSYFGRTALACPTVRKSTKLSIGQTKTSLSLGCPGVVVSGTAVGLRGVMSPGLYGESIVISVSGGPGGGSRSVRTGTGGAFSGGFIPGAAGTYDVSAAFLGSVLFGRSSAACHVTVIAPNQSNLAMNCPQTASPDEPLTLTATLTPAIAGASVDWVATDPNAGTQMQTVQTDATSTAYFNVTPSIPGAWMFTAHWGGDASHSGSGGSCVIDVQAPSTTTVTCPANGMVAPVQASVSGTVSPAVESTQVHLTYTPAQSNLGGTPGSHDVQTDASGNYMDSYTFDAPVKWTVTASFAGDAGRAPSQASCQFVVLSN